MGNVYPCVQWRRRLGNLHDQPIGAIWAGSAALERARADNIAAAHVLERAGIPMDAAYYCPGSAERALGRPDGVYEEIEIQAEVVGAMRQRAEGTA